MKDKDVHIVLIHGFASNKNIWQHFAELLAQHYTITAIDLPGHGAATDISANDLPQLAQYVAAQFDKPVVWLGWSLGGLIAQYLAEHYPEKTLGVITIAYSPKFVVGPDWRCAVNRNAFKLLEKLFKSHPEKAMTRFLSLQTLGDNVSKKVSEKIKNSMQIPPTLAVIMRDFSILENSDLRNGFASLTKPQLNILGEKDNIVPISVIDDLKALRPQTQNVTISSAAHLPFLSKEADCLTHINKFIHESIAVH